ncbi:MAG: gamma-glutamyltransferase [Rhodospirillales bacterium]
MTKIAKESAASEPTGGAVAAGHEETVGAARTILEVGGNAFDAAIAASLMACVAEPVLASLGGGGFLLARPESGESAVFDFFAQTPRRRSAPTDSSFFEINADFGRTTQAFHIGVGASATPGFIPGMFEVWRRHGSLPMTVIAEPAISAARRGVRVTAYQGYLFGVVSPIYSHDPASLACFGGSSADGLVAEGDVLANPELAAAIELLARDGERSARDGDLARAMVQTCLLHGGHLRADDLETYSVEIREPLCFDFRGHRIATNPPPSSGGILIAFGLGLLEQAGVAAAGPVGWDDWIRIMSLTFEARQTVHDGEHGATGHDLLRPAVLEAYARKLAAHPPSYRGTTHISVVDGRGNAATVTLSNGEGSGIMVPGCGFMLNNMLGEEDINPRGLGIWPEDTRMSSMMAPTLIDGPAGEVTALGSGGSNRIRTAMMQVIERVTRPECDLASAILAPRLHVEGRNLFFEESAAGDGPAAGNRIAGIAGVEIDNVSCFDERNMFFGGVHAVRVAADGRHFDAFGDERRAGCAAVLSAG